MTMRGSLRLSAVLAAVSIVALVGAPVASAGSVWVEDIDDLGLYFRAAPQEKNQVTVTASDEMPWTWVVTDTGAPLTAVEPCTSVHANTALCPIPQSNGHDWPWVTATLGDEDDWASLEGACPADPGRPWRSVCDGSTMMGESGNDTLIGAVWTYGGAGDDDLSGGLLEGGPGADTLRTGAALYEKRRRPVSVTLNGVPDDGEAGENDLVLTRDVYVTGSHDNILIGDGRANRIHGGGGNDVIRGGAGDDVVDGDPGWGKRWGDDRLYGGPGRDTLSGSGGRDRITGGAGRDFLHGGNGDDRFFARDRFRDKINGGRGTDRARLDRRLDVTRSIERRF